MLNKMTHRHDDGVGLLPCAAHAVSLDVPLDVKEASGVTLTLDNP